MNHTKNRFMSCIEACQACATACNQCFAACLQQEDVKMMARCIALDADCAAICGFAADAMERNSEHAAAICALCAQICKACAEECAKRHWRLQSDPTLSPGDLQLATELSSIDLTLAGRIDQLLRNFLRDNASQDVRG